MISLNEGQSKVVNAAVDWYRNSSDLVFQYTGAAGTGKTVVLHEIIRRLGINPDRIMPMSYTGTASIVMRNHGMMNAKTIHSSLYQQVDSYVTDEQGHIVMDTYFNKPKMRTKWIRRDRIEDVDLFIIDEASMTPRYMVNDIESFGIKIIACGDLNQLPPVGDEPGYLVNGKVHRLTQIMRQAENSGIVYLADRAIKGLPIQYGFYNNAIVIDETELNDMLLDQADIILCGRNNTREKLNRYMRRNIRRINSDLPMHGEPIICRKNNWSKESNGINLVNGLRGTVYSYPDVTKIKPDIKSLIIDFMDNGGNLFTDLEMDYQYYKAPYEDKEELRRNPYNRSDKFELAYAITTHLSQGSQYNKGIFIEEYLNKNIMSNLIYTGITRFSDKIIYVKPRGKFI